MSESTEQAKNSVVEARDAGDSLEEITQSSTVIVQLNASIVKMAAIQNVAADKVTRNIQYINEATHNMARTADELMSNSGDLSQTASMLQTMGPRFS
jgi:methyl-accepting chemotaxis protein